MKRFLYRVFFTKNDDVDISQVILFVQNVFFLYLVARVGQGRWSVPDAIVDAFLIVYGCTLILASPYWLAKLWIESKFSFRRQVPNNPVEPTPTPPDRPDEEPAMWVG